MIEKIGDAYTAYAETALAMQVAGEKAEIAAALYEDLVASCKALGIACEHFETIAVLFRGIADANNSMDFQGIISTCLTTAEVCR